MAMTNKKVAICLHGYFDSKIDSRSKGSDGFDHLLKRVYSKCDPDIYIHSWEPDFCQQINQIYKPKAFLYQPQIDFSAMVNSRDLHKLDTPMTQRRPPATILSHFYSIQKSFELCYQSGIDYDIVIKSRFDIGRINRNPNSTPVQCIAFDPNLDMSTIKMANWELFQDGPADMWFYSGYETMLPFTSIFNDLTDNFYIDSDFHKYVQSKDHLSYNDISNAVVFYKWWFKSHNLWQNKEALECVYE
jgi:hypothetical protein